MKRSTLEAVRTILLDGHPHTLVGIQRRLLHRYEIHATEQTVSARVRDLRKMRHGGLSIVRRPSRTRGVYLYQVEATQW